MRSTASHGAPQADPGTGGRAAAQCGVRGGAEHDLASAGRGEQAGRRFGRRRRRSRPGSPARAPRSKRRRPRPGRHSQKAIGRSRAHPRADSRMSRLVIAAELLGHARLETTRVYTRARPPRTAAKPSISCPSTSSGPQGRSAGPDAPFGLILAVRPLGGMFTCRWSPPWCSRDRFRAALTTPSRGPALATPAQRLLGGATLGVLLMHQFRDDPRDSVACFAERSLGGS